jgi:hypothetical protein
MSAPDTIFGRRLDTYGPNESCSHAGRCAFFSLCIASLGTEYYPIFLVLGIGFVVGAGGIFTIALVCMLDSGSLGDGVSDSASLYMAAVLVILFLGSFWPKG